MANEHASQGDSSNKIIVVSHYLPYRCTIKSAPVNGSAVAFDTAAPVPLEGGPSADAFQFINRRGHSALYSGISSLCEDEECLYLGCLALSADDEETPIDGHSLSKEVKDTLTKRLYDEKRCAPVFLESDASSGHYEGYCKSGMLACACCDMALGSPQFPPL
jgi:trehalose-6-phosphate synthase